MIDGENEGSARSEDALRLGERRPDVRHVLHHERVHHDVERCIGRGEGFDVALLPGHAGRLGASHGQHVLARIDGGDLRAGRVEVDGVPARSARDVEQALAANVTGEPSHDRLLDHDEAVGIRVVPLGPARVALVDADLDALHDRPLP